MQNFIDSLIDQYQTARDLLVLLDWSIDNNNLDVFRTALYYTDYRDHILRTVAGIKEGYPYLKRERELAATALNVLRYDIGRPVCDEWLAELDEKVKNLVEQPTE